MKLTFRGFLKRYCAELSGVDTTNIRKLVQLASKDAPRVAEPLFLFALEQDKLSHLLEVSKGSWMEGQYRNLASRTERTDDAESLLRREEVPARYRAVLDAYEAKRDTIDDERRIVSLMRDKTLEALKAKGITRYRLCLDMNLNIGNTYAYLNKGDVTKVSRDTARRIMHYACDETFV